MDVADKENSNRLEKIKKSVKTSYEYFKPNYDRYNDYRKFVFESSLSADDIGLLATLSRPQLEFNVLEAYISRLLGEFAKNEPSIEVQPEDPESVDPSMLKIVEQHLRHVFSDYRNKHTKYELYKDVLSGGFSVLKVHTAYASPLSMKQDILIDRTFDPTLCGFDTLARETHKGDGRFCFELFPMEREEFHEQYPHVNLDKISYRREFGGFNWSYLNGNEKILIVCDYYEKKQKDVNIVETADGKVMPIRDYNKMVKDWQDKTIPPPAIKFKRKTTFTKIVRTRCIETEVLEEVETDFQHLPLIFVDGNSVLIKNHKNGNVHQYTRPYVYHAKGAQKLKNWSGISLANEIENMVQHKFMVAKEALPKEQEFLDAWKDVQKPSTLVYNTYYEENPAQPIPNPVTPVQRQAAPPEIMQGFQGSDSLIQNILGSYDAALGINKNEISGKAIEIGALQSNAASMPYIVGVMNGLQRAAEIYVDLLPKYYITPRTIPMLDEEGNRYYLRINEEQQPTFNYDDNALKVVVEAGASFQVQKSRTIMMVKEMMGMSPLFAQFIAEKGLNFVLDNMEGRGIEQLKRMVDEWVQEQQAKQQAQQQMMMQNNPQMLKAQTDQQKLMLEAQKMQEELQLEREKLAAQQAKLHADLAIAKNRNATELLKAQDQQELEKMKMHLDAYEKQMELKKVRDRHHEA